MGEQNKNNENVVISSIVECRYPSADKVRESIEFDEKFLRDTKMKLERIRVASSIRATHFLNSLAETKFFMYLKSRDNVIIDGEVKNFICVDERARSYDDGMTFYSVMTQLRDSGYDATMSQCGHMITVKRVEKDAKMPSTLAEAASAFSHCTEVRVEPIYHAGRYGI